MRYNSIVKPVSALIAFAVIGTGSQVQAQAPEDYRAIVTIMRACAQIADVPARVLCYDNNIQARSDTAGSTDQAPPLASSPLPAPAPPAATAGSVASFGSEMLPVPAQSGQAADDNAMTAQVANIEPLEPGMYLVTLADGAQWRFVDAAPSAWNPPRRGDAIELERGSLGSVFLKYDGQRRLRVRRVR